jgi:tetratricopeptide (TPR) repeat protein
LNVPFAISDQATLLPTAFWLLLLLPGWALARRLAPRDLEGPPIVGVAVCYVCLFACLAPLVVVGYLVNAPIEALAALLGVLILWGAWDLIRRGAWRGAGKVLLAAACLEMLVVVVDMVMAARVGSVLGADARIHLTRVRFLYEHGLSNLDPFVAEPFPYPIYHTNLWHALLAAGSRLCAIDPLAMWFGSLAASKLMIASGLAYLAWAVCGGRWAPWVAAVMATVVRGPVAFTIYPNQIAPWFVMPVLVAVVIRAIAPGPMESRNQEPGELGKSGDPPPTHDPIGVSALRVAAVGLVMGMVHPLYAGFAIVIGGSVAAVALLAGLLRRRGRQIVLAAAVGAALVAAAAPFPIVGRALAMKEVVIKPENLARAAVDPDLLPAEAVHTGPGGAGLERPTEAEAVIATPEIEEEVLETPLPTARPSPIVDAPGFTVREGVSIARTPGRGFTGGWWRVWTMLLGAGCVIWLRRRGAPALLVVAVATILLIMLVPALCTRAVRFLGTLWMLERFETLAEVLWIPLVAPAAAACLEPLVRWRWLQSPLSLLAIPIAFQHGWFQPPYDWTTYREIASKGEDVRFGREYRHLGRLQLALEESIPPGSVVLVEPELGDMLTMLHDVRIVMSQRSSTGVKWGRFRAKQIRRMLAGNTDEARREELFEKYGVTHYAQRGSLRGWAELWIDERARQGGWTLASLRSKPDWTRIPWQELRRANRLMSKRRYPAAIAALESALDELDPPEFHELGVEPEAGIDLAWFRLGNARLWSGDPAAALPAYRRAVEIGGGDPRFLLMYGNTLADLGREEEGLEQLDQAAAIALAEDDEGLAAVAFFNLGNGFFRLDRLEEAIAAYDESLRLRPLHPQTRYWRNEAQRILDGGS